MNWDDVPSAEEVKRDLDALVEAKARLRVAELELEIAQSDIAVLAPRNRAAKIVGVSPETREQLRILLQQVTSWKNEVEMLEATVAFNNHRIGMAKALSFRGRW